MRSEPISSELAIRERRGLHLPALARYFLRAEWTPAQLAAFAFFGVLSIHLSSRISRYGATALQRADLYWLVFRAFIPLWMVDSRLSRGGSAELFVTARARVWAVPVANFLARVTIALVVTVACMAAILNTSISQLRGIEVYTLVGASIALACATSAVATFVSCFVSVRWVVVYLYLSFVAFVAVFTRLPDPWYLYANDAVFPIWLVLCRPDQLFEATEGYRTLVLQAMIPTLVWGALSSFVFLRRYRRVF